MTQTKDSPGQHISPISHNWSPVGDLICTSHRQNTEHLPPIVSSHKPIKYNQLFKFNISVLDTVCCIAWYPPQFPVYIFHQYFSVILHFDHIILV